MLHIDVTTAILHSSMTTAMKPQVLGNISDRHQPRLAASWNTSQWHQSTHHTLTLSCRVHENTL